MFVVYVHCEVSDGVLRTQVKNRKLPWVDLLCSAVWSSASASINVTVWRTMIPRLTWVDGLKRLLAVHI
jgi:hypothetical protein